ncbi:MAG TPA: glycosyltransferase family 39 protein [Myxococcota bacterium]|nr:glycosyltransferase family 39 protein [Myxococcota bacterium]
MSGAPSSGARAAPRVAALLVALAVFAGGLALFGERSSFPFYYHPDEPGKVLQLVHKRKNFHHPMLMLTTADVARRVLLRGEAKEDPQQVVEVARRVVAAFAAGAAALLALLAARIHGVWAGVAAGLLVVANPLLYELAHYAKEDPAFAFGLVAFVWAAHRFSARRDPRSLALLGVGAGVAAAGKYVGTLFVPVAALLGASLGAGTPRERWRRAARVAAVAAATWLVLDWWTVRSPDVLPQSVAQELRKAFVGEHGLVKRVPHAYYVGVQQTYGGGWVPALALGWLAFAAWHPAKVPLAEWLLAGSSLALVLAFSFTPKTSPRYYLPIAVALCYLSAAGAFHLAARAGARSSRARFGATALATLLCVVVAWQQWGYTEALRRAVLRDDRAELRSVVAALPAASVVAQDEAAALPEPGRRWEHEGRERLPQTVLGARHAADLGSLAELRARGVTHLALCEKTYGRFLATDRAVRDPQSVAARREFYRTALAQGRLVREWPPGPVSHLQPGLVLLDVSALE